MLLGGGAPPPPRTDAEPHGIARGWPQALTFTYWRRGPTRGPRRGSRAGVASLTFVTGGGPRRHPHAAATLDSATNATI